MSEYIPYKSVIVRYPSNSFSQLYNVLNGNTDFRQCVESDSFDEALLYVSPDLYSEFQKYKAGELSDKDAERMTKTLFKYFSRSCTRSTPFASLAYCAVAGVTSTHESDLKNDGNPSLHFTYDMAFLQQLAKKYLTKDIILDNNVILHANPTICGTCNDWHYFRQDGDGNVLKQELKHNGVLNYILTHILKEPKTLGFVKESVLNRYDIPADLLDGFLSELISEDILLTDICPTVIGHGYFNDILNAASHRSKDIYTAILKFKLLLTDLNKCEIPDERKKIVSDLWETVASAGIKVPKKAILHVDAFDYSSDKTISDEIIKKVAESRDFLSRVTPHYSNSSLQQFIRKYTERYETATVPLLEALDSVSGIGYGDSGYNQREQLVNEIKIPPHRQSRMMNISLTPFQRSLLKHIIKVGNNDREIHLNDCDLSDVRVSDNYYGGLSCSAMFRLINYDVDRYVIDSPTYSGISGIKLAARFAHGHPEIENMVKDIAEIEQQKAIIPIAEISHFSNAHVGNISERPKFRKISIDCLAYTDNDSLPLNDLYIRIDNGKIELYSHRLQSPVIPMLTTAHNYRISRWAVYRFLCDIQSQGFDSGIGFNWGAIKSLVDFTPRVIDRNGVVLARATWHILKDDIFKNAKADTDIFMSTAERLGLPRFMMYSEGDNDLFVDTTNNLSVKSFLSALKSKKDIFLEEFFPTEDIRSFETVNTLECIIPFIRK